MKQICVKNGQSYYIHSDLSDKKFSIDITDLKSIWRKILSEDSLLSEFKAVNPLVQSSDEKILESVSSMLSDSNSCDLKEEGSSLVLDVSKKIGPVKVKLKFLLDKGTMQDFFSGVMLPMVVLVNQLSEQQKVLCSMLKSKDLELKEYKMEGADISRRNVETDNFNESAFQTDSIESFKKKNSDSIVETKLEFNDNINKLFTETYRMIQKHKDTKIKEEPVFEEESTAHETGQSILDNLVTNYDEVWKDEKKRLVPIEKNCVANRIKKPRKNYFL
ncbi:uncharacterized protein LOC106664596 [Cimex lectularius]|uniref:Non-homologous end-joining factor 1 n=1 Tax=Cimex lectularius TaxID=79782 RepID=A0A8I6RGR3_CIMLE|nr:uncharacterized protein LOC106664596 [Cimex lectularius]